MSARSQFTLFISALLTLSFAALAAADSKAQIDDIVAPYVEANDFHGVVAVQRGSETPLILPYGWASLELGVPHSPDDIFLIGSVSKQFTAVAILLLEEAGMLETTDRVSQHLPDFPHGDRITVEQLLTHTSGVEDIYSLERFGRTAGYAGSFDEVIEDLGRAPLTQEPGSAFRYSNGGYAVLAAIIERCSGMSYGDYLRSAVFEPIGMASTAHDEPSAAVARRVPGYDPWGARELSPVKPISSAYSTGSGSLWSSAEDLLKWSAALHGGKLLSEASYTKLTTDHGSGYGYGLSVFRRFGRDTLGHDGRVAGYSSDLAYYVADRTTVAILGNVQSVSRDEIRSRVAAAVFGEEISIPEPRRLLDRPPVPLAPLEGVYEFGPGFEVSIVERDGRLLARANEGGYSELVAMDEERWFSRMLYATVRFGRDAAGQVDRLIWGAGDSAPVGTRLR